MYESLKYSCFVGAAMQARVRWKEASAQYVQLRLFVDGWWLCIGWGLLDRADLGERGADAGRDELSDGGHGAVVSE